MLLLSVVIPAHNEAENLPALLAEIKTALAGSAYEIIVVDDGSTDETVKVIETLSTMVPGLRFLRHAQPAGQSAALRTGLLAASGTYVATLDGDGQNDPAYLPALLTALREGGLHVGLVSGRREKRQDGKFKSLASHLANRLRARLLKDETPDSGCGLKILRRDLFLRLPFFDGWHRFLPALVRREGYRVVHLPVIDRPRRFGRSHYGIWDRALRGALDLFGVWWLCRRMRRVMIAKGSEWHAPQ